MQQVACLMHLVSNFVAQATVHSYFHRYTVFIVCNMHAYIPYHQKILKIKIGFTYFPDLLEFGFFYSPEPPAPVADGSDDSGLGIVGPAIGVVIVLILIIAIIIVIIILL